MITKKHHSHSAYAWPSLVDAFRNYREDLPAQKTFSYIN